MSSLLPRVLDMLLPTGLANSLQPVKGRTDGSRFALVVWVIRSQRDALQVGFGPGEDHRT